jgi:predicted enzyme related to lactoylglutathione lyase
MTSRLTNICIDAADPLPLARFWCAVLGWEVAEEFDEGVSIAPSDRAWPVIDMLKVRDTKLHKNRLHLDLRADGIGTSEELERLFSLGASTVDVGQPPDAQWVVLADPEGNEFCLLSAPVQDLPR